MGFVGHAQNLIVPVEIFSKKGLHCPIFSVHLLGERNQGWRNTDGFGRIRRGDPYPSARFGEQIADLIIDHASNRFMDKATRRQVRELLAHRFGMARVQRNFRQLLGSHKPGAQPIVNVVIIVGNLIGKISNLGL